MIIILFTLIEDLAFNQRQNPFDQAGQLHNSGLDYIGTNLTSGPTIPQLAANYMSNVYTTNTAYPFEMLYIEANLGYNASVDPVANLSGINLNGGYNAWVQKVFSFIDTFPPAANASTAPTSYVIFNNSGTGGENNISNQFSIKTTNLLNDILNSGLSADQMVLPLIAFSILVNSFNYWQAAYYNTGGSNVWYTYITGQVSSVDDIDWRQLIQQDIKGALAGAVAGGQNNPDNYLGGVITGAATGGMSASAYNLTLQASTISVYNPA